MAMNLHLIGNAHLDPVWLWRFQEGYAETKATFRSALDRISQFDGFIFTSACASYYKWIEENCPEMFEEIKIAVKNKRWCIVGAMWVQPDCNIPSAESIARHLLYSKQYFRKKFGISVKTGYNVDSFGHNGSLPKLLKEGGVENYVYMRPDEGIEKRYPFKDHAFRWLCSDGSEVVAFRINECYCHNFTNDTELQKYDGITDHFDYDFMMFYGVGNHGGGPTVTNVNCINDYIPRSKNNLIFSNPDIYFDSIREKYFDKLPVYEGELQNHASGCYSANSHVKKFNRQAENALGHAECLDVLAAVTTGFKSDISRTGEAWEKIMFNQFHDILCGCSVKAAYDDAYADFGYAISYANKLAVSASQKISWAIDTSKGVKILSKENNWSMWEADKLGTPFVVFNPLSHEVTVPVRANRSDCAAVTDENDIPQPFQIVRADFTDGSRHFNHTLFNATLPPYGWRTYWIYGDKTYPKSANSFMYVDDHTLENDRVKIIFDSTTGVISSFTNKSDGDSYVGSFAAKCVVIDDKTNDTWAHNKFYFDNELGSFDSPEFKILESGECVVSLLVKTYYESSILEQIFSLYPNEDKLHVNVHVTLNDTLVMLKLAFDSGIDAINAKSLREIPAGAIISDADGREQPMQRYCAVYDSNTSCGLAVINDCKYSSSVKDGELRFVVARSCYYADHYGIRDGRGSFEDIGETEFNYILMPYRGDNSIIEAAAEELNTTFTAVAETYHRGTLPQVYSAVSIDKRNISVSAVKRAENGEGYIVRFVETAGCETVSAVKIFGASFNIKLPPYGISSYRVSDCKAVRCDFIETEVC